MLFCSFSGAILLAQQSTRKEKQIVQPIVPAPEQLDFTSEKQAPSYNGGKQAMFKFIYDNMVYPADAKEKGIQGDVTLKFTVDVDGSLSNIEVVEGLYPSIDAEAVRVVSKMPKWIPGKYGIRTISMKSSIIIGFHLRE